MFCYKCGEKIQNNLNFCTHCGVALEQIQPIVQRREDFRSKKDSSSQKSIRVFIILLYSLLVVILCSAPILAYLNFKLHSGFYSTLLTGISNMLNFKEYNFSAEIDTLNSYGHYMESFIGSSYLELKNKKILSECDYKYLFDDENGTYSHQNERKERLMISENILYSYDENYDLVDIYERAFDQIWDFYSKIDFLSSDTYTHVEMYRLFEAILFFTSRREINDLYGNTNMEEFQNCYNVFMRNWNDPTYLEENYNFEKTDANGVTTYSLTTNASKLTADIMLTFAPSNEVFKLINEEIQEEIWNYGNIQIQFVYCIKNKILTMLQLKLQAEEFKSEIELNFSDFDNISFDQRELYKKLNE